MGKAARLKEKRKRQKILEGIGTGKYTHRDLAEHIHRTGNLLDENLQPRDLTVDEIEAELTKGFSQTNTPTGQGE